MRKLVSESNDTMTASKGTGGYGMSLTKLLGTTALVMALAPMTAYADEAQDSEEFQLAQADTESSSSSSGNEDRFIITATKREEDVQDVAQAVTAVNSDFLDATNSTSLEDFAAFIPSLDLQYFAPGQTRVTIRGISPDEQTGVSTVSYYFDEIAITSPDQRGQPDVRLYDVERVEFLRGPQGTLYGEGAMGGTIRIISRHPVLDAYEFSARGNTGFIEDGDTFYSIDGMINIPIIEDVFGVRVVGNIREDGGWVDQYLADPVTFGVVGLDEEDVNSSESGNIRVMARLAPTDNLTIDGTYIHNDLDVNSTNVANNALGDETNLWFGQTPRDDTYDLYNLTGEYAFDNGYTVVSSSSYTERDNSRTDPEVAAFFFGPGVLTESVVLSNSESEIFTQEIRLVSPGDSRFRYTVGGYYREGSISQFTTRDTTPVVPGPGGLFTQASASDVQTYAIFGEVEYDLTERLTVIGGLRWFEENEDATGTASGLFNGSVTTTTMQSRTVSDILPRVSLSYDVTDEIMVYGSYAEGYRSGGFNSPLPGVPGTYDPDRTGNYEIGVKYQSLDGRLTVNAAAFYIDWKDLQFIQLDSGGFFTYVGNANEASSRGLEIEAMFEPTPNSWISIGGNITQAELESDALGNFSPVIPAGTELPGVPGYKLSIAAGYDFDLRGDWILSLSGGVTFMDESKSKLEENGAFAIPGVGAFTIGSDLPSYETGNVRAELHNGTWSFAGYVNNVWNERAELGDDNFGYLYGANIHYNQPRTFGIEISVTY